MADRPQPPRGPLRWRTFHDAVVYPTIRLPHVPGKLFMGVFDGNGRFVEGSELDRRAGEVGAPVPRELFGEPVDAEVDEAVYAGTLYVHFGHFLVESLARTWFGREDAAARFVWAGSHSWAGERFRPWQREVLQVLGLTAEPAFVHRPVRYATLHVPDIGYRYDDWFHPDHADFLARYDGPDQEPDRRLWLSRSQLASDVRDLNAVAVERRLRAVGWRIVAPERLSVRQQLDELARASVVAGEEGSAFHALMLLRDTKGKRLRLVRRLGHEHRNMKTIGDARDLDQSFTTVDNESVLSHEGRAVVKVSANASRILDALDVPVACSTPVEPRAQDVALVRTVVDAVGATSYLELGVRDNAVLRKVPVSARTAVADEFDFDPRAFEAPTGDEYAEIALTHFLRGFRDGRCFDVIRVGGSPAQVLTTFRDAQECAGSGTVWILMAPEAERRMAYAVRVLHPGHRAEPGRGVVLAVRDPAAPVDEESLVAPTQDDARRGTRTSWPLPFRPRREGALQLARRLVAERGTDDAGPERRRSIG